MPKVRIPHPSNRLTNPGLPKNSTWSISVHFFGHIAAKRYREAEQADINEYLYWSGSQSVSGRLAGGDTIEDLNDDYARVPEEAFGAADVYSKCHPACERLSNDKR